MTRIEPLTQRQRLTGRRNGVFVGKQQVNSNNNKNINQVLTTGVSMVNLSGSIRVIRVIRVPARSTAIRGLPRVGESSQGHRGLFRVRRPADRRTAQEALIHR